MPSGWYNKGLYELANGDVNLGSSTIKAMLLNSAASFDRDHNFVSDVVANEITAVGYSRQTLGSKTVTENDTNDAAYWDCADVTFGSLASGQTVKFVVLYRDTGADATSPLLCCWQMVPQATDGTPVKFVVSSSGLTKVWSAT